MDLSVLYFFLSIISLIIVVNLSFSLYYKKKQDVLIEKLSAFQPLTLNKIEVTTYVSSKISSKSTNFFADIIFAKDTLFILQKGRLKLKGRISQLVFNPQSEQYSESTYTFLINSKKISNNCIVMNGTILGNSQISAEIVLDFLERKSDLSILEENIFNNKIFKNM